MLVVNLALGCWAATAAGVDLRFRRLPNLLLLALLLPAVIALAWTGPGLLGASPAQSLLGLMVATLPLLPGYAAAQLGAGDVKAAAVLGLLLGGPVAAAEMLLIAALLLGLACAWILLRRRLGAHQRLARIPAMPAFAAAFVLQLAFGRVLG